MIHPDTRLAYVGDHIGYGVFAAAPIPKGTITYVKDDLELCITPRKAAQLRPGLQDQVEKYSYRDSRGTMIVSWDIAKYVNHSCNANTMSTGWGFEIALRDIETGEEITDEYGLFNMDYSFPLSCAEPNCRRMIYPDDIDTYGAAWDAQVQAALSGFPLAEQPLLEFIDRRTLSSLMRYLNTGRGYRSVRLLKTRENAKTQSETEEIHAV